jgi:hypothetical protein
MRRNCDHTGVMDTVTNLLNKPTSKCHEEQYYDVYTYLIHHVFIIIMCCMIQYIMLGMI